jgi:hypothetical protein
LLTMAANAIMFDMQLHAAKYNGACHLPPRWYVMKYWAALACYSGMVQPRVAWHWGGAKAVSIPCCPELCRPNGMASNTGRHSHREYATSLAHAMSSNNIASRRHRSSYCPVPARTVYIPCRPCMTLGLYSIWRHRIVPPQCRTLHCNTALDSYHRILVTRNCNSHAANVVSWVAEGHGIGDKDGPSGTVL